MFQNPTAVIGTLVALGGACGGGSAKPDAGFADAAVDAELFGWSPMVTDQTGVPVSGADGCIPTKPAIACSTSDSSGAFTFAFPYVPTTDYDALAVSASGYVGGLTLVTDGLLPTGFYEVGGFDPTVWTMDYATTVLGTQGGFTVPSTTTGYLIVESHIAGATATISPATPTGAVYVNTAGTLDPTLTATTSEGQIFFGNVTPGRVAITVMVNGQKCTDGDQPGHMLSGTWPSTGSESTDAYVVAGAVTQQVLVFCP